ncbi:MAG: transposase [Oscillospiraceae bacterium]
MWLHTMISNVKSFIQGTYYGMERKHINLYLSEFCFRFNRRHFHEMLYLRL